MSVFKDRYHLPDVVEYDVREGGALGEEISRSVPEGITREIEANLVMNLNTAVVMRDWLTARIDELSSIS